MSVVVKNVHASSITVLGKLKGLVDSLSIPSPGWGSHSTVICHIPYRNQHMNWDTISMLPIKSAMSRYL